MKTRTIAGLLGLALFVPGCVVTSLNPFYTPADLVFDPALIGKWTADPTTNPPTETLEVKRQGEKGYVMTLKEEEKETAFLVHVFKLGNAQFMDQLPIGTHGTEFIPVHQLSRVEVGAKLRLVSMKYDWLVKILEEGPTALRHTVITEYESDGKENKRIVLTASTPELQAFVLKHLNTADAWEKASEMARLNTSTNAAPASQERPLR